MGKERQIVIGITGASGMIYARRLLEVLCPVATVHVVISDTARRIAVHEGVELDGFPAVYYRNDEMGASIASGSFVTGGMAIVPCSMKTLAGICGGYADTLIGRSADVALKEKRPCLLLLREMPLSRIHLRNMLAADEAGAIVMVASPPFYHHPVTIGDLVDMVVARVLDHMDVPHSIGSRWGGYDA